MAKFTVKAESLAVRCEICHQADLFNPATGICTRCAGIDVLKLEKRPVPFTLTDGQHFRYLGPSVLPRSELIQLIGLSGLVGSGLSLFILGLAIAFSISLVGFSVELVFPLLIGILLGFVFPFLVGCVTGYRTWKKLSAQREFGSELSFRQSAMLSSFFSTVILIVASVAVLTMYNLVRFHQKPVEAFVMAFLSVLAPGFFLFLFTVFGGDLIAKYQKLLARNQIEEVPDLREHI